LVPSKFQNVVAPMIPKCDGQKKTDGRTDRRTDKIPIPQLRIGGRANRRDNNFPSWRAKARALY